MNMKHVYILMLIGVELFGSMPFRGEEERRQEVEALKEKVQDPSLSDDDLMKIRQQLARELSQSRQDPVQEELINEKINVVAEEINRRVTAAPPAPEVSQGGRVYLGPNVTLDTIGDILTDLAKDPRNNSDKIRSALDLMSRQIADLSVSVDLEKGLGQYQKLSRIQNALGEARRVLEMNGVKALVDRITAVEQQVSQKQSAFVNGMLRDQVQQIDDARLNKGTQTVWRRVLDTVKSAFSFIMRAFRSSSGFVQDLGTSTTFFKQLESVVADAKKRFDSLYSFYGQDIARTRLLLEKDVTKMPLLELRSLRQQLSTVAQTNRFYKERAQEAFKEFKNAFDDQVTGLTRQAEGIAASLRGRVVAPEYSSLYDQFDRSYFKELKSAGYSLKREEGRGWVPDALGFTTYSALLEAPFDEIDDRWRLANLPENKGNAGWATARELHIILSDPISRENFRAYLDAQGLIDSFAKGPEVVNKLALPASVADPLAQFSFALSNIASVSRGVDFFLPDFDVTQREIEQKIAQIDERLEQ